MEASEFNALWAPWRVQYFSAPRKPDFLLEAAQTTDDRAHLVLVRRRYCFLIMNAYPYAVGHLMAVPYRKAEDLAQLSEGEWMELRELTTLAQKVLRQVVKAEGFNVGLNLGSCAGASMATHLHLHIVPRWTGDNNFMAVLDGTRVLPEALDAMYERLSVAFTEAQSTA